MKQSITPQIQKIKEAIKEINKNSSIIDLQEVDPTCVVLSGGGAKGNGLAGSHKALKDTSVLDKIESVAGTSAGSIGASFMAAGVDPDVFAEISRTTSLKGLLGKGGIFSGGKDGKPLYELIGKTIRESVAGFLDKTDVRLLTYKRIEEIEKEQKEIVESQNKERDLLKAIEEEMKNVEAGK